MASHKRCQLPQELDSDQQAAVLYSPFREKSLNPQSWSRKFQFWERLLLQTALETGTVAVDVGALSLMFERKGMSPKCLGTVIEEMKKTGQIQSVDQLRKPHSWLSWGFNTLVKQPLSWGLGQFLGAARPDTVVYVWPAVVKKLCQEVIELYQVNPQHDLSDSLVSLAQLRSLCQTHIPSDSDFHIVLTQLERDHKITTLETEDKEMVIKFCKRGEISASPIREIDVQIYRIRVTESRLEKDIEALSLTADTLLSEARMHLREGKKAMAKHCLRKKKVLVATMDNRYACLSKLQDILHSIQDASTHEMVVKACAAGALVMTNVHKQLTVEGVEAVMDDVREAIEVEEEIQQAMSSGLDVDDQDELERDLRELLSASVSEGKTEEKLTCPVEDSSSSQPLLQPFNQLTLEDPDLPDVPLHSPYSSRQQATSNSGPSRQQATSNMGPSRQHATSNAGPSRQQATNKAGPSRQQAPNNIGT